MRGVEEKPLKAPYTWPGGKAAVADYVWGRIGDVENAVEPFAGSLAWLLRRPAEHFAAGYRVETMNDVNQYVVNFWRAVQKDPEAVARYADWPVTEADLHARHRWLVRSDEAYAWKLLFAEDPDYFDARVAGWWCWGLCCWIGSGWCDSGVDWKQTPELDHERGLLVGPAGRPQLADAFDIGRGVNGNGNLSLQIPVLRANQSGYTGQGVNQEHRDAGTCDARRLWLTDWMQRLADRLRLVRTCYGHWSRVCDSESTLTRLGLTGVFLDPPYPTHSTNGKKSRSDKLYASDRHSDLNALRDEVLDWCKRWGGNPGIRAAVCCYEGDGYEELAGLGWEPYSWEASGGYGNQARGGGGKAENAKRERIYFSPHCLPEGGQPTLFSGLA